MRRFYSHLSALVVLSPQYLTPFEVATSEVATFEVATSEVATFEVAPPYKTGCMVVPFPYFFAQN